MLYQESILSQIKDSFLKALVSVFWNALHPGSAADMDITGGRADSTAPCRISGHLCFFSRLSICRGLFSGAGTNMFDSISNSLAYVETCKNFNLLFNIPN